MWDWDRNTDEQTSQKPHTRGERKEHLSTALADVTRQSPAATVVSSTPGPTLARLGLKASSSAPETWSAVSQDSRGNRARQNGHFRRCAQEAEVRLPICQSRCVTPRSWNLRKSFSLRFSWLSRASPVQGGSAESEPSRDEHDVRRHAAHRFYLRVHRSACRGWEQLVFLTCDQTPREGKDPRPRVPRASKREVTSLASFGGGGDASHVLYFRESYLQECERIQCGIHCQVSPVQSRFHLRVCGDNFESCHGCFGWTSVVKH